MKVTGGEDPGGVQASIGRMLGLVYPRAAGRGEKYFQPAPQFLDALVVALLEPGEEIPETEFWERVNSFGVVCGALGTADTRSCSPPGACPRRRRPRCATTAEPSWLSSWGWGTRASMPTTSR